MRETRTGFWGRGENWPAALVRFECGLVSLRPLDVSLSLCLATHTTALTHTTGRPDAGSRKRDGPDWVMSVLFPRTPSPGLTSRSVFVLTHPLPRAFAKLRQKLGRKKTKKKKKTVKIFGARKTTENLKKKKKRLTNKKGECLCLPTVDWTLAGCVVLLAGLAFICVLYRPRPQSKTTEQPRAHLLSQPEQYKPARTGVCSPCFLLASASTTAPSTPRIQALSFTFTSPTPSLFPLSSPTKIVQYDFSFPTASLCPASFWMVLYCLPLVRTGPFHASSSSRSGSRPRPARSALAGWIASCFSPYSAFRTSFVSASCTLLAKRPAVLALKRAFMAFLKSWIFSRAAQTLGRLR